MKSILTELGLTLLLTLLMHSAGMGAGPGADVKTVRSFLNEHCVRCHGKEDPEGKVSLHALALDSRILVISRLGNGFPSSSFTVKCHRPTRSNPPLPIDRQLQPLSSRR